MQNANCKLQIVVLLSICFLLVSPIISRSQTKHLLISKIHPQKSVEKYIQKLYQPSLNIRKIEINQDVIFNEIKKGDNIVINLDEVKEYSATVIKCGKSYTGSKILTAFVEGTSYSKIVLTSYNEEIFGIIKIIDEDIRLYAINTNPQNKNTYLLYFDPENQNFFSLGKSITNEIQDQLSKIDFEDIHDTSKLEETDSKQYYDITISQDSNDPLAVPNPALSFKWTIDGTGVWYDSSVVPPMAAENDIFNIKIGEIHNPPAAPVPDIEPIPNIYPYEGTGYEKCIFLGWSSTDWPDFINNVETGIPDCYTKPSQSLYIKFRMPAQNITLTANFMIPPRGEYGDHPNVDVDELTLMILYTPKAEIIMKYQYGGGVNNFIALHVENLNYALGPYPENLIWDPICFGGACSKVLLAHYAKIDYLEYNGTPAYDIYGNEVPSGGVPNLLVELNRLTCTDSTHPLAGFNTVNQLYKGYMDDIHTIRDNYNCDLVLLFTESGLNGDITGIAHPLWNRGLGTGDGKAFAVIDLFDFNNSRILSFIHEIGHLLGAGHHKQMIDIDSRGPQIYANSAGWQFYAYPSRIYDTVMTYGLQNPGDHRIGVFSNPYLKLYQDDDIAGHIQNGYNARTIEYTQRMAAMYRINDGTHHLTLYCSPEYSLNYKNGNQITINGVQWTHGQSEIFQPGDVIAIVATESEDFEFDFINWSTSYIGGLPEPISDPDSPSTTLTMPNQHLILTANFLPPLIFRPIINGIDIDAMAVYADKAVVSLHSPDDVYQGVYIYDHASEVNKWLQLYGIPAAQIQVDNNTGEIVLKVTRPGYEGIYRNIMPNTKAWEQISDMPTNYIALAKTSQNQQKAIIASFTGIGLYGYDNSSSNWSPIIQYPAETVFALNIDGDPDGIDELLITLEGIDRLYLYSFETGSCEAILMAKPSQIFVDDITGDGKDDLICAFAGVGTYIATCNDDKDTLGLSHNFKNKWFQWTRITLGTPDDDHLIATGYLDYGSYKEVLMTYNGSTYYYQYDIDEWSVLAHAPFKRIISGKFSERVKDDLILYNQDIERLFIYGEPE